MIATENLLDRYQLILYIKKLAIASGLTVDYGECSS